MYVDDDFDYLSKEKDHYIYNKMRGTGVVTKDLEWERQKSMVIKEL